MGTTGVGDPAGPGERLEAGGERRGAGAAEHEAVREPMKWRFTEARIERMLEEHAGFEGSDVAVARLRQSLAFRGWSLARR